MSKTHGRFNILKQALLSGLALMLLSAPAMAGNSAVKDYEAFGRQLVEDIKSGDVKAVKKGFNTEELARRVLDGITLKKEDADSLRRGILGAIAQVPGTIMENFSTARLTFVRIHKVKGVPNALVRVDFGENGLNYMDMVLQKDHAGHVMIVDWTDYTRGTLYTDTFKQLLVPVLPQEGTILETLFGTGKLTKEEARQYTLMLKLSKAQDIKRWKKEYPLLPKKIGDNRALLISHVLLMSLSGDQDAYAKALKRLNQHYGKDPTLALTLLDHYFLSEDYAAAHRALKDLSKYTGGDAALDDLRAKVYIMEEKYKSAMKYAEKAVKADSRYDDAYFTLMDTSVYAGQYKKTVKAMERLKSEFGMEFDPTLLETTEGYEKFVASKEYLKWKAGQ